MSDSEIKLFYAQSSEVKNRILAPDEHLRSIDTGAYYVAGPDGKPQAVLTASTSDQGVVIGAVEARAIKRQGAGYLRDVILFGDSLSEMNTWSGPTGLGRQDNGYLTWASALAGVDINVVRNAGIGGNTTAQMLARVDADVLAYPSDVVIEMSGINAITTIPVADQIANRIAIWQKLLAAGRYVIAMSTTPHSIGTDPTVTNIASINALAAAWWRGRSDGEFVDLHPYVTDTSVATAPWKSNYTYDNVHPTNLGAFWLAQALVPTLKRLFAPRSLISSPRDALQYNAVSKQILPNPLFLGSGGTNGAGCSGTIAANWAGLCGAGVTAVHSLAAANSGCGNKQIITITASAAGYYTLYDSAVFSAAVVGDILTSAAQIKVISGVNIKGLKFGVASQQSSIDWGRPSSNSAASVVLPSDFTVLAESYGGIWTAGSTYGSTALKVDFSAAGSAVLEIERAELRRR